MILIGAMLDLNMEARLKEADVRNQEGGSNQLVGEVC